MRDWVTEILIVLFIIFAILVAAATAGCGLGYVSKQNGAELQLRMLPSNVTSQD